MNVCFGGHVCQSSLEEHYVIGCESHELCVGSLALSYGASGASILTVSNVVSIMEFMVLFSYQNVFGIYYIPCHEYTKMLQHCNYC